MADIPPPPPSVPRSAGSSSTVAPALQRLWEGLHGDPSLLDEVTLEGAAHVLASVYDVTGFAAGAVALAALGAAEVAAVRAGTPVGPVSVERTEAAAAFLSEQLLEPLGWARPPLWDPVAGDHRAADGWIRLHTNYAHHRRAALGVLGVPAERAEVAAAVERWERAELEAAVVEAGGCAAAMYDRAAWFGHEHGRTAIDAAAIELDLGRPLGAPPAPRVAPGTAPLAGLRVLDLTRVIAGPACTRFLAAHGADVLRIDPPGFEEVPALVPDTTVGKRCATLDLRAAAGRRRFLDLARGADVVVSGLRPGALDALGLGPDALRAHNPALVVAELDAYGWAGPWRERRGFDSLVQMSCGIAAAGAAAAGADRPTPLPAQALDHGTGYLVAAGVCRGLAERERGRGPATIRASLVGAANALVSLGPGDGAVPPPRWPDAVFEEVATAWGRARRVRCPGRLAGRPSRWVLPAGPLGTHPAAFGGPGGSLVMAQR